MVYGKEFRDCRTRAGASMAIRIVTDSTADLPESIVADYGITVIPVYINVGGRSYLDGVELSRAEFYQRLPDYDPLPQTSSPGLGTFIQTYERLADSGAVEILSIHISAKLSGVMNVANSAAQTVSTAPVTVFDSRQLSLGTGFLAVTAAQAAAAGHSMAEIVAMLEEQVSRTHSFAILDTLEYLRRGGRLSRFQSGVGALLRIRPVLTVHNGEMGMERVRTHRRAQDRLVSLLDGASPIERLALIHAHAPERVEILRQRLEHLIPANDSLLITEVTPAIGTHVGPGSVGIVCVKARKQTDVKT
jgi:DegV family protein with EDD domain